MGHRTALFRDGTCRVVRSVVIEVDVDSQFPADYTVVIDVRAEVVGGLFADVVLGSGHDVISLYTILGHYAGHHHLYVISEVSPPLHLAAEEMVVGHLPVHSEIAVKGVSVILVLQRAYIPDSEVLSEGGLVDLALLAEGVAGIVYAGEEVDSSGAVVYVQRTGGVVVLEPARRLGVGGVEAEAEAVALAPDGTDAHYAAHRGIVLGAGVGDDLDALYLIALQAVQFGGVCHLAAVDVDEGRAFADDFEAVGVLDEARGLGQDVTGRSDILQDGAADVGLQAFAREFGLGHDGSGDGALKQGGVRRQPDHGAFCRRHILRPVAQHRYHQDAFPFAGHYIECAVLAGDGAAEHRRVGLGEDGDIGVSHGVAVLVQHFTLPVFLCECGRSREEYYRHYKKSFHCNYIFQRCKFTI